MKPTYKKYFVVVLLVWGVFLPVLLGLYLLLLVPQKEAMEDLKARLAEKELEYGKAKVAATDEARGNISKQIEQLTQKLSVFTVDFDQLDNLTFSISRIASETQVGEFSSRESAAESYSEIRDCTHIGQTSANIGFTGGFNKFAAVVNALERHKPIIFVDEFSISDPAVTMQLTVFVRRPWEGESKASSISGEGAVGSSASSARKG